METDKVTLGSKAPEFSLKNQDGQLVDVKFADAPATVLFFYPKDNTPGTLFMYMGTTMMSVHYCILINQN